MKKETKYVIVYLIKGIANKYQKKLIKDLAKLSKETHVLEKNVPPHITLKYSLKPNNIKETEKLIETFTKNQKPFEFNLNKFDNFNKFVTFLKPDKLVKIKKIQKSLLSELSNLKDIEFIEFDLNFHPHVTLCYGNTPDTFNKIWKYLQNLSKPNLKLSFNNITILKKPKDKWIIHKEYKII